MARKLDACWIGADLPEKCFTGSVHSVFARACNLQDTQGGLWALLAPDLPRSSWSIRVQSLHRPFETFLERGMTFVCDGRSLRVPSAELTVRLDEAERWDGDYILPGRGPCPEGSWQRALALAGAAGWPGLCALLHPADEAGSVLDRALLETFARARENLLEAAGRYDIAAAVAACRGLLGLGQGLTPAGDDFVGGFLAGLRVQAAGERQKLFAAGLGRELERQVAGGTGTVAAGFLAHACRGSFAETLSMLAVALRSGLAGREIDSRVRDLLAFGGTSGADTLAGLLSATGPDFWRAQA